jgi:flagellin-like protein
MKGVSPLIATVLLIAISLTIASLIMGWATTLVKEQTGTISNRTGEAVECTGAIVTIDDVYIDFSANKSRVHVRNSGQINLDIISASLSNQRGEKASNLTAFPITGFDKGIMKQIEFNITNVITACGNFSKAIVSTSCGNAQGEFTSTPICVS